MTEDKDIETLRRELEQLRGGGAKEIQTASSLVKGLEDRCDLLTKQLAKADAENERLHVESLRARRAVTLAGKEADASVAVIAAELAHERLEKERALAELARANATRGAEMERDSREFLASAPDPGHSNGAEPVEHG